MNVKKILIILLIIVLVALIGYIVIVKLAFNGGGLGGDAVKSEHTKKSDLGDEFVFMYEDRNFPDSERVVNIMDSTGKELITFFVTEDKTKEPGLLTVVDLPNIRCYEISGHLLYKVSDSSFKGIDVSKISKLEPNAEPAIVDVTKALIVNNDWKWIKSCGEFLLKADDNDVRKMLERYANGQFTQEEIKQNKNSEITKEDMQNFAKRLLKE